MAQPWTTAKFACVVAVVGHLEGNAGWDYMHDKESWLIRKEIAQKLDLFFRGRLRGNILFL
jgi:hypothetical protein